MPESSPPSPPKKRCTIYVDGFNWYFGIRQCFRPRAVRCAILDAIGISHTGMFGLR